VRCTELRPPRLAAYYKEADVTNTVHIKIFKDPALTPTHDIEDVPWFAGITVLQAMVIGEAMYHQANLEFRVKYRSVYGAYVDSIDGLADGDKPNHSWMLYIDGKASSYGASESLLFEDDSTTSVLIEWKYEDMSAKEH
jgi:Domain of unknown function (DUF4430)